MEKSGRITLTSSEYKECVIKKIVPVSIKQAWGISDYQELEEGFLANGNFEVVNEDNLTNVNKEGN